MKKVCLLLALLLLLPLWGCGSAPAEPVTEPPATETPTETEACVTAPAEPEAYHTIYTPYFTIPLTEDWYFACEYELREEPAETSVYTLTLWDYRSKQEFGGGKLCTLMVMPPEADYKIFPSYEVLGKLYAKEDVSYNLVALYPSDVQFDENTVDVYKQLERALPELLAGIAPVDGCSFAPAK